MVRWSFTRDPAAFLDAAGSFLASDPLVATVVATVAERYAARAADPAWTPPAELRWFATAHAGDGQDDGEVVGAAMRTHPAPPHALFVLPCPDDGAVALARALHDRGEALHGLNGTLPAVRVVGEEVARLSGTRLVEDMATRIFEVTEVVPPPAPPGRLRRGRPDDVDLCSAWLSRFDAEADAQAGREPGPVRVDGSRVAERVADGTLWVWEVDGEPVHVSTLEPPARGMSRLALVYTAPEHRGRGYAAAAVAELSARRLSEGSRVCLFADRDNPTSTAVYERIGFRAVVDAADLLLVP
ncbi:GNAT family N-acetyltransferase [Nocardioides sp. CFH 31398]|uniref:GNAT family N-acetyltransferase n=1 Tax=Nocardioides sp. CFH 31398 TaxID=2919579 RepID=UPI001F06CE63|nr:GNAT family N-acetyltransferase [Nocardioides sp. CFH 31398]MCH1867228.1 GNAT family N-acetyltransferase [Nocardioides sp. CFH 31398]